MTSKKFFDDKDDIIEDIDPASEYENIGDEPSWIMKLVSNMKNKYKN